MYASVFNLMFLGMFNCELIAFMSGLFCVDGEMIAADC